MFRRLMDQLQPRDETRYEIAIRFKPSSERTAIEGLIPRREYKRLLKEMRRGKDRGTYEFILDGHVAEQTFPIQEIDTILVLPEMTNE